ncbi:MAG: hypothetical protein IJ213_08055 [Bacteroidales bacterium]|nr:hypothetical protein [Bacteroidales bacterium]
MEKRIGTISIFIYNKEVIQKVNELLSDYSTFILSRNGLPLVNKGVNIITLIIEAPTNTINALNGSLGRLVGVEAKVNVSKYIKIVEE